MLQERLRERKGENTAGRRESMDTGERAFSSSPLKGKEERRPSSSGTGKGMGVKQIEEVSCDLPCEYEVRSQANSALARLYINKTKF